MRPIQDPWSVNITPEKQMSNQIHQLLIQLSTFWGPLQKLSRTFWVFLRCLSVATMSISHDDFTAGLEFKAGARTPFKDDRQYSPSPEQFPQVPTCQHFPAVVKRCRQVKATDRHRPLPHLGTKQCAPRQIRSMLPSAVVDAGAVWLWVRLLTTANTTSAVNRNNSSLSHTLWWSWI